MDGLLLALLLLIQIFYQPFTLLSTAELFFLSLHRTCQPRKAGSGGLAWFLLL